MEKTISHQLIKIAIVGPESTGKSTLAAALAQSFNTLWVKEFAREYCDQLKGVKKPNGFGEKISNKLKDGLKRSFIL